MLVVPVALGLALATGSDRRALAQNIVLDGSLGPAGAVTGPDFEIEAGMGATVGPNLFHSFERFGIGPGESATFTGPDGLANVISRVTGGEASAIDGALRSEVPGADFWFINPAGVMFGENASIDVPAAFHVGTADEVRFADGAAFSATDPDGSRLTVAPPDAFGFTSANPAALTIDGSELKAQPGQTVSLVAGDIRMDDASLTIDSGRNVLISADGPGHVGSILSEVNVASINDFGDVALTNSRIVLLGESGGDATVRADNLHMDYYSKIEADTTGAMNNDGSAIDIALAGDLSLTRASALTSSTSGDGNAGAIMITANSIEMSHDPQLGQDTTNIGSRVSSSGDAADIIISAERVAVRDEAFINTYVYPEGSGHGGNIEITANELYIGNSANIAALTNGSGQGGSLFINPDQTESSTAQVVLDGNAWLLAGGYGASSGDAGDLILNASFFSGGHNSIVASSSFGSGESGNILFNVDSIILRNNSQIASVAGIPGGDGGTIRLIGNELQIFTGSRVVANSMGPGDAGNVEVDVDNIGIFGVGQFFSQTDAGFSFIGSQSNQNATGDGGNIEINAVTLQITDGGKITADTFTPGRAGNITIDADSVRIVGESRSLQENVALAGFNDPYRLGGRSSVSTGTSFATNGPIGIGHGGSISLIARDIEVSDGGLVYAGSSTDGAAGDIEIHAQGTLLFGTESLVSVQSQWTGTSGNLLIYAGDMSVQDRARIIASANRVDAGRIDISVRDGLRFDGASISSFAAQGEGGQIAVQAGRFIDLLRSEVTSSIAGEERGSNAGDISLSAPVIVLDGSRIVATARGGNGGNIRILADAFLRSPDSVLDATSELGVSGRLEIQAPDTELSGDLVPLPAGFLDASRMLPTPCTARLGGQGSSLTRVGGGGPAIDPGRPLVAGYARDVPASAGGPAAAAPVFDLGTACGGAP